MRILFIISCFFCSSAAIAENANLHKLSLGLAQPKLAVLTARAQRHELPLRPLAQAVLWQAPPYAAMTRVQSPEAQQAVDTLALELLLEGCFAKDPKLKSTKISTKIFSSILGLNLATYNDPALQQINTDIVSNYATLKDYYQARQARDDRVIKRYNAAKQHLVRLCGVEAVQQVINLWHQDAVETKVIDYTKNLSSNTNILRIMRGRIAIIDFGTLISGEVLLTDDKLAKIYTLSGLDAEEKRTIIAVHGLKDNGEADLSIATASGSCRIHLIANASVVDDVIYNPKFSRSKIYDQVIDLGLQRSLLVNLPAELNQYVLAGDASLINLDHLHSVTDPQFWRSFVLSSGSQSGFTDIVVASRKGVFKISLDIKKENNYAQQNNINLGD